MTHVRILDVGGRVQINLTFSESEVIDVASLAPGVYILEVENNAKKFQSRVVIAR
jgi:hypothetical protein